MKVGYNIGDGALRLGKIQVRWSLDTSKMKVEYNDGNGARGLRKIKLRWRSDTSKIEVWLK